jgi:hypothetical protein
MPTAKHEISGGLTDRFNVVLNKLSKIVPTNRSTQQKTIQRSTQLDDAHGHDTKAYNPNGSSGHSIKEKAIINCPKSFSPTMPRLHPTVMRTLLHPPEQYLDHCWRCSSRSTRKMAEHPSESVDM